MHETWAVKPIHLKDTDLEWIDVPNVKKKKKKKGEEEEKGIGSLSLSHLESKLEIIALGFYLIHPV